MDDRKILSLIFYCLLVVKSSQLSNLPRCICYKKFNKTQEGSCSTICGHPPIWPYPTTINHLGERHASFTKHQLKLVTNATNVASSLINEAFDIFIEGVPDGAKTTISQFIVTIDIADSESTYLLLYSDESYTLTITEENDGILLADIQANNFFGARHGLETLAQLIWWDNEAEALNVISDVDIKDTPTFTYRGLMLDTGRNYFPLENIRSVLVGMATVKLNVFHWHITDAESFPFDTPSVPEMAAHGAYSAEKLYTDKQIKDIVEFAKVRGIRVIIEVDIPSHVNFGWQWGPSRSLGRLTQGCGNINKLLNRNNNGTLEVLQKIYRDILTLQTDTELLHMGGNEVTDFCPNQFEFLWAEYMSKVVEGLYAFNRNTKIRTIILWSSSITSPIFLSENFDKGQIVIQQWQRNSTRLLKAGYKMIFSPSKYWYLSSGFGGFKGDKDIDDTYRQWQEIYAHRPWMEYRSEMKQVVGGEICLWSDLVGPDSLDTKIWPRAAAFAERVWTDSNLRGKISTNVYFRLKLLVERLRKKGIRSEEMWPERCEKNPEVCF